MGITYSINSTPIDEFVYCMKNQFLFPLVITKYLMLYSTSINLH